MEKTLEELFGQTDEVIAKLESADISLEESFAKYQEGMELLKAANAKIDTIEKQVMMISGTGDLVPFAEGE